MSSDNYVSPLGLDVETLEASFNLLAPQAEELVRRFYDRLFQQFPEVVPLFANTIYTEELLCLSEDDFTAPFNKFCKHWRQIARSLFAF